LKHLFVISCLLLELSLASASKGKEVYKQHCLECHVKGGYLASQRKAKTWKKLFLLKDDKNTLQTLHLQNQEAKVSWSYFSSQGYLEDSKHLRAFLEKYSKDLGKHNSCH